MSEGTDSRRNVLALGELVNREVSMGNSIMARKCKGAIGENCWCRSRASGGGKAKRLMITRLGNIQVGEGQCFIQVS